MEKENTSLARTRSEQLVETVAAAFKSPSNNEAIGVSDGSSGGTLSRKSSKRLMMAASPGRSTSGGNKNTHIRKSRSAQMKFDLDDVSSGAALSRASSASLGFSFSFTGFNMPPDEIADSKPFSDDDIRKYIHTIYIFFYNSCSYSACGCSYYNFVWFFVVHLNIYGRWCTGVSFTSFSLALVIRKGFMN